MGSTRLPGKVLHDLAGRAMLDWVAERAKLAQLVNRVVVATTVDRQDDAIVDYCRIRDVPCFRGSVNDVLDRYYQAAIAMQATTIIRLTADCPLLDPQLLDTAVAEYQRLQPNCDYLSIEWPKQTFPRGLDFEVLSFACLKRAWTEATETQHREHVTAYIYQHADKFRIAGVECEQNLASERWTVDTEEDLALASLILGELGGSSFGWQDVLRVLHAHPDWQDLNRHVRHRGAS